MKKVLFGIELDDKKPEYAKKLRSDLPVAFSRAFCELYPTGNYTCKQMNILANEVIRGRLYVDDTDRITKILFCLQEAVSNGMSYSEIVVLRSLYYEFEDIVDIARKHKKLKDIIQEQGLEDSVVENVPSLTSAKSTDVYVSLESAMSYAKK